MVPEHVEDPSPVTSARSEAVPEGRPPALRYVLYGAAALGTIESLKALFVARSRGLVEFGALRAFILNMPWWLLWVPLAPVIFWLGRRTPLRQGPRAVAIHAVAATALSLAHLAASSVIVWAAALRPPGVVESFGGQFRTLLGGYLLTDIITYGAILAGYTVFVSQQQMRAAEEEQARLRLAATREAAERARLEALMSDARLRALRSELDPHFLFNSLNSVSALARAGDTEGAVAMISRLGQLLRITIDGRDDPEVSLREEAELLEHYLEIEGIRFGDRLRTRIRIDPAVADIPVPALILQPLVENALRHGVSSVRRGVSVEVEAEARGDELVLVVRDTGRGLPDRVELGTGLRNVGERLEALHGADAGLALRPLPERGTEAVLTLPLRRSGSVEVGG